MGRYRGPVEKLSRREGVQLYLKGARVLAGKSALERHPYPPGEHGRSRQRPSDYRQQLREKQKAKRLYGLRERQFRRLFQRSRRDGELLRGLELRLDNVLFRLGFASTRAQARQFVTHGHVLVNGRKVDVPSCRARPGDRVSFRPASPVEPLVREATDQVAVVPRWLLADHEELWGRVEHEPTREEIDSPVDEQLIVELYSR